MYWKKKSFGSWRRIDLYFIFMVEGWISEFLVCIIRCRTRLQRVRFVRNWWKYRNLFLRVPRSISKRRKIALIRDSERPSKSVELRCYTWYLALEIERKVSLEDPLSPIKSAAYTWYLIFDTGHQSLYRITTLHDLLSIRITGVWNFLGSPPFPRERHRTFKKNENCRSVHFAADVAGRNHTLS